MSNVKRARLKYLAAASLAAISLAPCSVAAQSGDRVEFEIEAQDLADALADFGIHNHDSLPHAA